jgi:hypothetical protein
MKQGAGILLIHKENKQLKVLLAKRQEKQGLFSGLWGVPGDALSKQLDNLQYHACAVRALRQIINIDIRDLLNDGSAKEIGHSTFKIPFLMKFETWVVAVQSMSFIDQYPRLVKDYNDFGWFSTDALPAQVHVGVHYTLGVINAEKIAAQEAPLL